MDSNKKIDQIEAALVSGKFIDCPVTHTFVPGMYIRKIFMPKGVDGMDNIITSLVHNTQHPFFVMSGKVAVYSDNDGVQFIEAPYFGITTPGTRRVLVIIEDTVWITCHRTDIKPENDSKEAVDEAVRLIGEQILAKYENPLLGGHYVNNSFVPETIEN